MKNISPDEVKRIAVDLFHGRIFTDRQIANPSDAQMVFMPLALMKPRQLKKLRSDPPGMIFEYLDKAGPRSINGMPMFPSCQMLSLEDAKTVLELYNKLKDAEKAALT